MSSERSVILPTLSLDYGLMTGVLGITIPILPGIMPIQNYQSFRRMTNLCKSSIPAHIVRDLELIEVRSHLPASLLVAEVNLRAEQRCGGQELRSGSGSLDDPQIEDRGDSRIPSLYAESGEEREASFGIIGMGHAAFDCYQYRQATRTAVSHHLVDS